MVETQKKEAQTFSTLFGKKDEAQPKNIMDLSLQLNNVAIRLRILEERYSNMRKSMQVTEQNMLKNKDQTERETKLNSMEITELTKDINDIKLKIRIIVNELRGMTKKEDVDFIRKYVNMWDPIKYVSQNEVDRIVENKVMQILEEYGIQPQNIIIKRTN